MDNAQTKILKQIAKLEKQKMELCKVYVSALDKDFVKRHLDAITSEIERLKKQI